MKRHPLRSRVFALILLLGAAACSLQAPAGRGPGGPAAGTRTPESSSPASPSPASPSGAPVPAMLAAGSRGEPGGSSVCLAQIEAFAELHSGSRVMLGLAAFADSDQLVLTRLPRRGPDGTLLDGRAAPPRPLVLTLSMDQQGCLVRLAEEAAAPAASAAQDTVPRSARLPDCTCRPPGS